MERGSSKHSPRLDEEMQHETEGLVRSNHATRADEGRETEPVDGYAGPVARVAADGGDAVSGDAVSGDDAEDPVDSDQRGQE